MGNSLLILGSVFGVLVVSWIWKLFYSIWWRPMQVDRYMKDQGIRGPPYRLLFGNLKEYMALRKQACGRPMNLSHHIGPRVLPFLHQTMETYGKVSLTWEGNTPRINIMDAELIREVLSNKLGHFEKPERHPIAKRFVTGVASYIGDKWAKHRKIVIPAFHLEKLKNASAAGSYNHCDFGVWHNRVQKMNGLRMLPAFSTSCSELISRWEKSVGLDGSCELDVSVELQNLTGDVISRTAFGSSYKEGMRIFQLQTEQAELLIQSIHILYIPGYRFLPAKQNTRRTEIAKEVHALLRSIIEKREKAMKMGDANCNDLLGLLMESNFKYSQEQGHLKSTGITIEDVIEECKLFYFAGQETTSVLLTWTMVALSMHPTWQVRAREEVLQIFGKDKPDFDGLSHLKIVTMILYEVLRLYPPLTFLIRSTYKEMRLGGFTLPPGVQLCLPALLIHHDPELWGKDADEFNPDRFAEGVLTATKSQFAYFPFGWGLRICIGQKFGMIEAKLALAMILQHFSFELSPTYVHAP